MRQSALIRQCLLRWVRSSCDASCPTRSLSLSKGASTSSAADKGLALRVPPLEPALDLRDVVLGTRQTQGEERHARLEQRVGSGFVCTA